MEVNARESTTFTFKLNSCRLTPTDFTLATEVTSGIEAVLEQTSITVSSEESVEISVSVSAGSSPGSNQLTIIASYGATSVTASVTVSVVVSCLMLLYLRKQLLCFDDTFLFRTHANVRMEVPASP